MSFHKEIEYIVKNDMVEIILNNYDSPAIIDKDDLKKVLDLGYTFAFHKSSGYVAATLYLGVGKDKKQMVKHVLLQDLIMGKIPNGYHVDHINHDVLDNRKSNLRVITHAENNRNRKGRNSNNKSGYRNVFWNTGAKKWQVSLCKNNERIMLGLFDDVDEAGLVAEEGRRKYYGVFAGKN